MAWDAFRLEFPNTSYYDTAFNHYKNFYSTLQNPHVVRNEIIGYAEYHERIQNLNQRENQQEKDMIESWEIELKYLLTKTMRNDEQERVALLCNKILPTKVIDEMFTSIEILIRNIYGAAAISTFIPRLVRALKPGSPEMKRLSISLDLEYSLEAMKKISENA